MCLDWILARSDVAELPLQVDVTPLGFQLGLEALVTLGIIKRLQVLLAYGIHWALVIPGCIGWPQPRQ